MSHKYVGGREVLHPRPHPSKPGVMQVKFRTPPRVVNGEVKTSVWEEMSELEYRKKRYFEPPAAGTH